MKETTNVRTVGRGSNRIISRSVSSFEWALLGRQTSSEALPCELADIIPALSKHLMFITKVTKANHWSSWIQFTDKNNFIIIYFNIIFPLKPSGNRVLSISLNRHTNQCTQFYVKTFLKTFLKMLRHVSIIRSSSGSCLFLAKITLLKTFTAWYSYNNLAMWQYVVLCRLTVAMGDTRSGAP